MEAETSRVLLILSKIGHRDLGSGNLCRHMNRLCG